LALLLVVLISTSITSDVPDAFPETWHSWVSTTMIRGTKTLVSQGQLIAFNFAEKYACRYDQQNLFNISGVRMADFCDFNEGYHYHVNNSHSLSPNCKMGKLDYALKPMPFPTDFVNNAKKLGTDRVNQKFCYHYYYSAVRDGSRNYGMDLWFTNDTFKLPCQIVLTDTSTNPSTITTWAFDGLTNTIPPDAIGKCELPKAACVDDDYVCNVKDNADKVKVQGGLEWVCGSKVIDCSPINPGGDHFYPDDLVSHANWAFNAYYLKNKAQQGSAACDFGGTAHLVPPKKVAFRRNTTRKVDSKIDNLKTIFNLDITCSAM